MPENPKKEIARINVPKRSDLESTAAAQDSSTHVASTSQYLMSRLKPDGRDTWLVPLAGLLLAFSAISFIVQLLIAFS